MNEARVIVVGAGAAGIAAARHLQRAGFNPLVLEARARIGGRAWTDVHSFGVPLDMGCAWLHSADRNPWMTYAREQGFNIIERSPVWRRRIGRDEPSEAYRAEWGAAYERNDALIQEAAARGLDVAVADLIPQDKYRAMFDAVMTWLMGADSERVSSLDYARYADSEVNWSVESGLGAIIAHAATGLDIRLNTPVLQIESRARDVLIQTNHGTIEAAAIIVTVPTNVIASGTLRFVPDLPENYSAAFTGVPLGVANKVFFRMKPGTLPFAGTTHFVGSDQTARTASYATRPSGHDDILLAYFGGSLAIELEQRGELEHFARKELTDIFGAGFTDDIVDSVCTAWSTDPWSLGSYSVALPGQANSRHQFNEPLRERILFAGEACSIEFFGTIHGAWFSAVSAAERALSILRTT
ncbi:MAG: flavin monoamine oxidase family protein [Povalibacter sp.]